MKIVLKKQLFIASCIAMTSNALTNVVESNPTRSMIFSEGKHHEVTITREYVYVGQMLVGYGLGWSAPVIAKLQDPELTPLPRPLSDGESSWVGSLLFVGTIIGPYVTGFLSNIKGRVPCLFLGGSITLLSFLILALASNIAMIFTGRILSGLGTGIIFVVNLVYIGEIASTNIRGILLTVTGIFSTFGTLIVYTVGPYVSYSTTSYIGLGITCVYLVGLFFIPETPVFQMIKGKEDEAKKTLLSLGRGDEIEKILNSQIETPQSSSTRRKQEWLEIFTVKVNRKALFITLTLGILQQMSGVIAVIFFATSIFDLAGSSIDPGVATIIIGLTQIFASSITPFFVERSGRKSLLLYSTIMCFISLTVLGVYFFLDSMDHAAADKIKWLPLVTLIIFFLSFDLGFGIIPGTLIGEMFLPNVRSTGSTFTITIAWVVGFGISTAFGYMVSGFGADITFWIYASACAVAFLFTLVFVPETKGKSLFEIQDMLANKYVFFKYFGILLHTFCFDT